MGSTTARPIPDPTRTMIRTHQIGASPVRNEKIASIAVPPAAILTRENRSAAYAMGTCSDRAPNATRAIRVRMPVLEKP